MKDLLRDQTQIFFTDYTLVSLLLVQEALLFNLLINVLMTWSKLSVSLFAASWKLEWEEVDKATYLNHFMLIRIEVGTSYFAAKKSLHELNCF